MFKRKSCFCMKIIQKSAFYCLKLKEISFNSLHFENNGVANYNTFKGNFYRNLFRINICIAN